MFFESHAHYDDKRYNHDRDELLKSLPASGIDLCLNAGADMRSSKTGIKLAERYSYIYASVGIHPHYVKDMKESDITELRRLSKHPKVVAIGEAGLDFHYDNSPRDAQRHWFKKQLELAIELGLPAIIHSRESTMECYEIVKEYAKKGLSGVLHCYSGSAEIAISYAKLGFYIGIGGVITFPKVRQLLTAVEALPLDKILLETDCPYLSPAPYRGDRNDSSKLIYIAKKIAEAKNVSIEEVAGITKENAIKLFFNKKMLH